MDNDALALILIRAGLNPEEVAEVLAADVKSIALMIDIALDAADAAAEAAA